MPNFQQRIPLAFNCAGSWIFVWPRCLIKSSLIVYVYFIYDPAFLVISFVSEQNSVREKLYCWLSWQYFVHVYVNCNYCMVTVCCVYLMAHETALCHSEWQRLICDHLLRSCCKTTVHFSTILATGSWWCGACASASIYCASSLSAPKSTRNIATFQFLSLNRCSYTTVLNAHAHKHCILGSVHCPLFLSSTGWNSCLFKNWESFVRNLVFTQFGSCNDCCLLLWLCWFDIKKGIQSVVWMQ